MIWIKVLFLLIGLVSQTFQSNSSVFRSFVLQLKTCFNSRELLNCVKNETIHVLDNAIRDKSEWKINDMISIKTNDSEYSFINDMENNKKSFEKSISDRILRIFGSRHLEIKFMNNVEEGKCNKNVISFDIVNVDCVE